MTALPNKIMMMALMFVSAIGLYGQASHGVTFERIYGFPSEERGISLGVSACYAGAIGDTLVMAGGCNFPDVPATDGGNKRYYRGIYAAVISNSNRLDWKLVGWLPQAAAYGVSVAVPGGLLCIGGCNEAGSLRSVWMVRLHEGRAVVETMPMLPRAMDNFAGASQDGIVMVSDGREIYGFRPADSSASWYMVCRVGESSVHQPVCGFVGNAFSLWGGMMKKDSGGECVLQMGGWQYDGEKRYLPGPADTSGDSIYLGGAATVNLTPTAVLAVGGVNREVFLSAVNHPEPDYMNHPAEWYRFNPYVCVFQNGAWSVITRSRVTARAGAMLVKHGQSIYIIGGELKPGVRTPEIFLIRGLPIA